MSDRLYTLDKCFDRRALQTPHGRRKAHLFEALTPPNCTSVLDAGGGTGWSTIGLRRRCRVVTLDSSAESLALAPGEKVLAGVTNLPFGNLSFDMVLSSQVLEHLPDNVFQQATAEMSRVARHCLLVSVPYREALETRYVRCGRCGSVFHPDHHCRSFAERDLAALFPGWIMAEWHVFGTLRWAMGVDPPWTPAASRSKGRLPTAPDTTICTTCGARGEPNPFFEKDLPVRFRERVFASLTHRLERIVPALRGRVYSTFLPQEVAPYWLTGLFIREGALPLDADVPAETHDVSRCR